MYERREDGSWDARGVTRMPQGFNFCARERHEDEKAEGGEDGRSEREREDDRDRAKETWCKKQSDQAENVVIGF